MCQNTASSAAKEIPPAASSTANVPTMRRRKRDKQDTVAAANVEKQRFDEAVKRGKNIPKEVHKRKSKSLRRHENDNKSGGVEALIPSLIGVTLLACALMAKMGFRGRVSVAGIDLGTTNSVVCVQALSKSVGEIECIPDPASGSPIVPSVISFLDSPDNPRSSRAGSKDNFALKPHPSHVIVGNGAKLRIDTHPHHTLYHAKRVLGRSYAHDAVRELAEQVEFELLAQSEKDESASVENQASLDSDGVLFRVPFHSVHGGEPTDSVFLTPQQVGSYVVNHLIQMTWKHLGHDNVKSAVIAVPAKFDAVQRQNTVEAFKNAGVKVTRILEEPTAAALAYGLHKKENVDYIMVYDFGGGTLDVSILHVSEGGYVEVMGSDGDDRLGGADFDYAVADFLLETNNNEVVVKRVSASVKAIETRLKEGGGDSANHDVEEILTKSCPVIESVPLCTVSSFHTIGEKMKIGLSSHPEGGGTVKEKCLGLLEDKPIPTTSSAFCSALQPIELIMTSAEFDSAVKDLYGRSMLPVRRILSDLSLQKSEIDEVVMVGGTTRMPQIRLMLREELDIPSLNTGIDPDLTVAYGAASVID